MAQYTSLLYIHAHPAHVILPLHVHTLPLILCACIPPDVHMFQAQLGNHPPTLMYFFKTHIVSSIYYGPICVLYKYQFV